MTTYLIISKQYFCDIIALGLYRDLEPQQIYPLHGDESKCQYSSRVLDIKHGTFTPLIFTAGGMGEEWLNYHSRLAELIAIKKGEDYAKTL